MPQLNASTYFSQYIYLTITFIVVYYFVTSFFIPNVVTTTKLRHKISTGGTNIILPEKKDITNFNQLEWVAACLDDTQVSGLHSVNYLEINKMLCLNTSLMMRTFCASRRFKWKAF